MIDPPAPAPAPAAVDGASHGAVVGQEIKAGFAYLVLKFYNGATEQEEVLPKGTQLHVYYIDDKYKSSDKRYQTAHSANPVEIAGDDGKISFKLEKETKVTFEIRFKDKLQRFLQVKRGGNKAKWLTQAELGEAVKADSLFFTKEMLFAVPNGTRLQNSTWKIENCANYDAGTKLFDVSATKQIKGDGGHLPAILQPEWQFLQFRHHDPKDGTDQAVPQGLWLFGYNLRASSKRPMARSNIYLQDKNCVLLPWIRNADKAATRQSKKVALRFKTSKWYTQKEGGPKIVEKKPEDVAAMTLTDRMKIFDLPPKWSATNWLVKYDSKWEKIADVINKATTKDKPIIFYLDSVTLTDTSRKSYSSSKLPWSAAVRFTVFDNKMKIFNPEPKKPYMTKGTLASNFFTPDVAGKHARVISRNGKFYDVTFSRSIKGSVVGARAGIKNDKSVHYWGTSSQRMASGCGNFELHYFANCLDSAGAEAAYLLIYWSGRFRKKNPPSSSTVVYTDLEYGGDRDLYHEHGFSGCIDRWEKKKYEFRPTPSSKGKNITVYPRFFFEGRTSSPRKCKIWIRKQTGDADEDRADMGLTEANFFRQEHKASTTDTKNAEGESWGYYTMAHELGHATGQDDEYLEGIDDNGDWDPALPEFSQSATGCQYAFDKASIMEGNYAPRGRHYWYFCRWLNNRSGVKALTAKKDDAGDKHSTVFQAVGGAGDKFKYFLKKKDSKNKKTDNFYKAAYTASNRKNGTHGKFDLRMYKVGHDETTELMVSGKTDFDAILVLRVKLQFFFRDTSSENWTKDSADRNNDERINYMKKFQKEINSKLNGKFWFECGDAKEDDYKKVYLYVVPRYKFGGTTPHEHKLIRVHKNAAAPVAKKPSFHTKGFKKKNIDIDQQQNMVTVMRYILGLKPCNHKEEAVLKSDGTPELKTDGTPKKKKVVEEITTISKDDLGFLADWIKSQRHDRAYTAKQV
ncbi:MAG: hypothetical protein JSU65_12965 [Candidatus Zixiibacteriota bacterium]|nr:MAG: hypothetical protein JSU65_12965 [candidate division Zixibacteria bacterium]